MPEAGSVTTLELFLDLVFVFALTQVTATMADDLTGRGLLRGILVIALLWWSWTAYVWLANLVRADEGIARVGVLQLFGTLWDSIGMGALHFGAQFDASASRAAAAPTTDLKAW